MANARPRCGRQRYGPSDLVPSPIRGSSSAWSSHTSSPAHSSSPVRGALGARRRCRSRGPRAWVSAGGLASDGRRTRCTSGTSRSWSLTAKWTQPYAILASGRVLLAVSLPHCHIDSSSAPVRRKARFQSAVVDAVDCVARTKHSTEASSPSLPNAPHSLSIIVAACDADTRMNQTCRRGLGAADQGAGNPAGEFLLLVAPVLKQGLRGWAGRAPARHQAAFLTPRTLPVMRVVGGRIRVWRCNEFGRAPSASQTVGGAYSGNRPCA